VINDKMVDYSEGLRRNLVYWGERWCVNRINLFRHLKMLLLLTDQNSGNLTGNMCFYLAISAIPVIFELFITGFRKLIMMIFYW
jgi:hypothetical protein